MIIDDLFNEVVKTGLCTRCGACVGFCSYECISWDNISGLPVKGSGCTDCNLCMEVCPGKNINYPELWEMVYPGQKEKAQKSLLGYFENIFLAYSSDNRIRQNSSSGGVITSLFVYLLESGWVDSVLVLGMDPEIPYHAKPILTNDSEIVRYCSQSKYIANPILTALNTIIKEKKKFAIVALPCQIHALRKMQGVNPKLLNNIKLIIGLYCGNLWEPEATTAIVKKVGIKNLKEVKSVQYRAGAWPGKIEIKTKSGNVYSITKEGSNYLSFLYTVDRCFTCTDYTAELADLSVGDGWYYENNTRGKGWSVVVTRTSVGNSVATEALKAGIISGHEIDYEAAIKMHSHHLNNKKIGAYVRIAQRKKRGLPVPDYHINPVNYNLKRWYKERLNELMMRYGKNYFFRSLVHIIPIKTYEVIMKKLRRTWIKRTQKQQNWGNYITDEWQ